MQARVPAKVAEYYGIRTNPAYGDFPLLAQTFTPGKGWSRYTGRKRLSISWVRKLKADGVTAVAVNLHGRVADFSVNEILRYAERPLLAGSLIGSRTRRSP